MPNSLIEEVKRPVMYWRPNIWIPNTDMNSYQKHLERIHQLRQLLYKSSKELMPRLLLTNWPHSFQEPRPYKMWWSMLPKHPRILLHSQISWRTLEPLMTSKLFSESSVQKVTRNMHLHLLERFLLLQMQLVLVMPSPKSKNLQTQLEFKTQKFFLKWSLTH